MSKPTPGPWAVKPARTYGYIVIGADGLEVAECSGYVREDMKAEANAHLIAAAPKMLDALEAQDALDRHTVKCPRCAVLQPCDEGCRLAGIALDLRTAALAKVRGVIA